MDSSGFTGVTGEDGDTGGTMSTIANTGALTTITILGDSSSNNLLVGSFITPSASLTSTQIIGGLWQVNLFTNASDDTSVSYYASLYTVDSSGNIGDYFTRSGDSSGNNVIWQGGPTNAVQVFQTNNMIPYNFYVPDGTLSNLSDRLILKIYAVFQAAASILVDFRGGTVSHLHTTLAANPAVGPTGATGFTGFTGASAAGFGNVLRVDSVNGNDSTAAIGGLPFLTVGAAITYITDSGTSDASGNYNYTIWVMPGIYTLSSGITLPRGICLRGLNTQTVTLKITASTDKTLLTMGENCRVEDMTLSLTSTGHNNLTGILFPGTTASTAKLRTTVTTVDNSAASFSDGSGTIVAGVLFNGTGGLTVNSFSFNAIKGSTINVKSNGSGKKRGILVTGSTTVTVRDVNVYVAAPPTNQAFAGSYVGVETADPSGNGSIQLRTTTVGCVLATGAQTYTASDILQTTPASLANPTYLASPGIQIGPGTDLVTKTAGQAPFSTYNYPTTLFIAAMETITSTKTGYLAIGTIVFKNSSPTYPTVHPHLSYRVQQPMIVSGFTCKAATAPGTVGGTKYATFTVCKNVPNFTTDPTTPDYTTIFTITLTGTQTTGSFYNGSVNFNAGDTIIVYMTTDSNYLADVSLQVDCF